MKTNYQTYLIRETTTGNFKIGKSKDPFRRFKDLQTGNINIELVGLSLTPERELHDEFSEFRLSGEWFSVIEEYPKLIKHFEKPQNIIELKAKFKITDRFISKVDELYISKDYEEFEKFENELIDSFGSKEYKKLLSYEPFMRIVSYHIYMRL